MILNDINGKKYVFSKLTDKWIYKWFTINNKIINLWKKDYISLDNENTKYNSLFTKDHDITFKLIRFNEDWSNNESIYVNWILYDNNFKYNGDRSMVDWDILLSELYSKKFNYYNWKGFINFKWDVDWNLSLYFNQELIKKDIFTYILWKNKEYMIDYVFSWEVQFLSLHYDWKDIFSFFKPKNPNKFYWKELLTFKNDKMIQLDDFFISEYAKILKESEDLKTYKLETFTIDNFYYDNKGWYYYTIEIESISKKKQKKYLLLWNTWDKRINDLWKRSIFEGDFSHSDRNFFMFDKKASIMHSKIWKRYYINGVPVFTKYFFYKELNMNLKERYSKMFLDEKWDILKFSILQRENSEISDMIIEKFIHDYTFQEINRFELPKSLNKLNYWPIKVIYNILDRKFFISMNEESYSFWFKWIIKEIDRNKYFSSINKKKAIK